MPILPLPLVAVRTATGGLVDLYSPAEAVAMNEFWVKALDQVPALAVVGVVLLFVVAWFLRSIKAMADDGKAMVTQFLEHMRMAEERCERRDSERDEAQAQISTRTANSLDRNTEALGLNTGALALAAKLNEHHGDMVKELTEFRADVTVKMKDIGHMVRNFHNEFHTEQEVRKHLERFKGTAPLEANA